MFTGLIEAVGKIEKTTTDQNYLVVEISSDIKSEQLQIGESIAVDGTCLTVTKIGHSNSDKNIFEMEISQETLAKTTLSNCKPDQTINLERALKASDRLGGHFLSGHIDTTGLVSEIKNVGQSLYIKISYNRSFDNLVISKGSIAINGVSLTVNQEGEGWLEINLIPHTLKETTLSELKKRDAVNLEFDMIGKFISKQFNQLDKMKLENHK